MKNHILWIASALALSTLFSACGAKAPDAPMTSAPASSASQPDTLASATVSEKKEQTAYHKITAEEAKKMMDAGGVTVVDVRRQDEYNAGHIPGSILIPNETIESTPPELLPDLDATILVHCRTGIRSKQASDKLVAMGYTSIYDFGGIQDWPYETVTE